MNHHSTPELPHAGKVALVPGASRLRGIGAAVCRALADQGASSAFTHWRPYDRACPWAGDDTDPDLLLADLRARGVPAEAWSIDLAEPTAPDHLLAEITDRLGPVHLLINNAAHSTADTIDTLDAASLDAHAAVNLRATALLTVGMIRRYPHPDSGRVVNLTSGQSLGPMGGELAYAATKGAVEAFTRSVAPEAMTRGVTVNAVNPGPTDTGWITDTLRTALIPKFPAGRIGTPEDAARLIAWLCSPEAAWITGQVINSEGGFVRE